MHDLSNGNGFVVALCRGKSHSVTLLHIFTKYAIILYAHDCVLLFKPFDNREIGEFMIFDDRTLKMRRYKDRCRYEMAQCRSETNRLLADVRRIQRELDNAVQIHQRLQQAHTSATEAYHRACNIADGSYQGRLQNRMREVGEQLAASNRDCADLQQVLSDAVVHYRESQVKLGSVAYEYQRAVQVYERQHARVVRYAAQKAGIPMEYRVDPSRVKAMQSLRNGAINLYFGGIDAATGRECPDGDAHGHYVLSSLDDDGVLLYARNPGEPHNANNHVAHVSGRAA